MTQNNGQIEITTGQYSTNTEEQIRRVFDDN